MTKLTAQATTLSTTIEANAYYVTKNDNALHCAIVHADNGAKGLDGLVGKLLASASGRKALAHYVDSALQEARDVVAKHNKCDSWESFFNALSPREQKNSKGMTCGLGANTRLSVSDVTGKVYFDDKINGRTLVTNGRIYAYNSIKSALSRVQKEVKTEGGKFWTLSTKLEWKESAQASKAPTTVRKTSAEAEQPQAHQARPKVAIDMSPLNAGNPVQHILDLVAELTDSEALSLMSQLLETNNAIKSVYDVDSAEQFIPTQEELEYDDSALIAELSTVAH